MYEASLAACAATVRRSDPDRYFSALFAPTAKRPFLFALYALNHEFARVAESVREPMLGHIRLQWWREALVEARQGTPRRHDVVEAMAVVFSSCDLPGKLIDQMIDARAFDVSGDEFPDDAALERYLDHTSATLMRLAAHVLGGAGRFERPLTHAGIAYGLTGVARSVAFHVRRGKCIVPRSQLDNTGTSRDSLLLPANRDALLTIVRAMAARAIERYRSINVRAGKEFPLVAFLPASLVPLYARQIRSRAFDPTNPELGLHWRLATLLSAAVRSGI